MGIDVLTGLLDQKLIKVISLFAKNPEKKFYLSEVSKLSNVNPATTFRILKKLVKENIIIPIVIGKVRVYQLSGGERAKSLSEFLKKDYVEEVTPLEVFLDKIKLVPHISKIILDSKTQNSAKLIIVSEFTLKDRILRICDDVYNRFKFKINFVELKPNQFDGLRELNNFDLNKKVLFRRS